MDTCYIFECLTCSYFFPGKITWILFGGTPPRFMGCQYRYTALPWPIKHSLLDSKLSWVMDKNGKKKNVGDDMTPWPSLNLLTPATWILALSRFLNSSILWATDIIPINSVLIKLAVVCLFQRTDIEHGCDTVAWAVFIEEHERGVNRAQFQSSTFSSFPRLSNYTTTDRQVTKSLWASTSSVIRKYYYFAELLGLNVFIYSFI